MEMEEGHNQSKTSPKRIKFQEIMMENEEEDQISTLPDFLLTEILSRLTSIKDAIRTGALCKRWKHLWTVVPTLSFIDLDYNFPKRSGFFSFVDKILTQCRQLKLKKFKVCTSYDTRFESQVSNWIHYAISCNVEELILKFWYREPVFQLDQLFFIRSCFTDLTLEGCILNPSGAISWKNLRSLCVSLMKLDEDLIENILSGSPLLETLVLEDCYGYRRLNITSESVKNLVLIGYTDLFEEYDLSGIMKINAPNIFSLTIKDDLMLRKLSLLNVSSLVEANLYFEKGGYHETMLIQAEEEMLKEFILNLRHVKELKIGSSYYKALSRLEAEGFVLPSNIKFPGVTDDCSESESESEHWSGSGSGIGSDLVEIRDWY